MKLKSKVVLITIIMFLLMGGFISVNSYYEMYKLNDELSVKSLNDRSKLISRALDGKLDSYFSAVKAFDTEYNNGVLDETETIESLKKLQESLDVHEAFYASIDGHYLSSFGESDTRNVKGEGREWFERSLRGDKDVISKPYLNDKNQKEFSIAIHII
ncbi:PDC sensor domain-containing protein [Aliivibrio finisterrensis]|uniref:PDC sensor domain-containing protein n=1 Tax=Aliivibrio finisterrensis TaxID=511998 RepID=UPI00142EC980|nr:PDC sensor domain-containing protein [Aliivibrio finisterrensis]